MDTLAEPAPSTDSPTPTRLRVRLTPAAEKALSEGHPWVYAESVREQNRPGLPGEAAVIYDRRNRFAGIGLFDPESPIRLRVLYVGKPRPLDADWWRGHLDQCIRRRATLFGPDTTGYRICNGESDGWPGLVLDRYGETLALKLYTVAWLPRLPEILALIGEAIPCERVVLRLSRNVQQAARDWAREHAPGARAPADGTVVAGAPLAREVVFLENGIRFEADVLKGQKTGFFLDQRDNRARVGKLAQGREVLNGFSYSGGFSLYAARGGAVSVTNLDLAQQALDSAQRNVALNTSDPAIRACRHEYAKSDVLTWLRASQRQFDLVVLDPPSFARREAQREDALQAYGRLARAGIDRLRRGGILVSASCSAHVTAAEFFTRIRQTARKSGRAFRELAVTEHPEDHPATFLEAHYLKCIYLRLD